MQIRILEPLTRDFDRSPSRIQTTKNFTQKQLSGARGLPLNEGSEEE
jgi:hypothetical protein